MKKIFKDILLCTALSVVPTLLLWAPFYFQADNIWGVPLPKEGMQTLVANYDGPLYIAVAKSLYNPEYILNNFSFTLPAEYYVAHFPLFPLIIRLFAFIAGYPWGMLLSTILASIFSVYYFKKLAEKYVKPADALWLTFVFTIFPARWLIVRSVGSPEPLFVGAIIAAVYYFNERRYWLAGLFGAIAQLTKSPGILLFLALGLSALYPQLIKLSTNHDLTKWLRKLDFRAYPILLIPLSLTGVFTLYKYTTGNFFAYFNSGDNIHLFFPPFQIFNYSQPWVQTHWLEEIIFVYLLILVGLISLWKMKMHTEAILVSVFFSTIIFVSHRDIIRYSLPVLPFLIIGFSQFLKTKEAKIIISFLLLPIFLFSLAFISNNIQPVADWGPLL
ncbi:hypothetical protein C4564_04460 [Candidatus Microgenomates bacterium]|nr:MAG: hypothetical protein C4564_04460 [Candidatus Microgenomates bacterium]